MAKRKRSRGRRSRRYVRGNIDEALVLDVLAGLALVSEAFDETVEQRTLISSIVSTYTAQGQTSDNENDGPILVGVAHSDYSDAEIEAYVENIGSWNEGDLVNQETSKRWIRKIGTFQWPVTATEQSVVLNDGKPIKTKLNWILNDEQGLKLWAYNQGISAILTGAEIFMQGHANLWPTG